MRAESPLQSDCNMSSLDKTRCENAQSDRGNRSELLSKLRDRISADSPPYVEKAKGESLLGQARAGLSALEFQFGEDLRKVAIDFQAQLALEVRSYRE
jgi:hypothetical protein